MADIFRPIRIWWKRRKKRLAREEAAINEAWRRKSSSYARLVRKRNIRRMRTALIWLAAAVCVIALILAFGSLRTYHSIRDISAELKQDVVSTKYVEMKGKILRAGMQGASLLNRKLEETWFDSYSMQNPIVDVREGRAVIADKDGTAIRMYDMDGLTGYYRTPYRIVKARTSKNGTVAVIMDNGEDSWLGVYTPAGSVIFEKITKIDDPGFPMDVCVSNDGIILMVAFQFVEGNKTASYVAFYNFGSVGQSREDHIVSGFRYDGVIIPQVVYLNGNISASFRDDGITFFQGRQIPGEGRTIHTDTEIISTVYDKDTVGMVYLNGDPQSSYTYMLDVYTSSGKHKFSKGFNIPYTNIRISDGYYIMYNSSQVLILDSQGREKFMGTVDGTIHDFLKIGYNRYLLVLEGVTDGVVKVVKLR